MMLNLQKKNRWILLLATIGSLSCGTGDGSKSDSSGAARIDFPEWPLEQPRPEPTGLQPAAEGGISDDLTRQCDAEGALAMKLPVTGAKYCVHANAECTTAGAGCWLLVHSTANNATREGTYKKNIEDPSRYGPGITVGMRDDRLNSEDFDEEHAWAEMPRVIFKDYPGLDPDRIYAIGFSKGAQKVGIGTCRESADNTGLGTVSDIYAATAGATNCPCADGYPQLSGNFGVFNFIGTEDPENGSGKGVYRNAGLEHVGSDDCELGMRWRATVNGCQNLGAKWTPIRSDDEFAGEHDPSVKTDVLDFRPCQRGDVIVYRGHGTGHRSGNDVIGLTSSGVKFLMTQRKR